MKRVILGIGLVFFGASSFAQEEPDTTTMTIGGKKIIIITPSDVDVDVTDTDTIDASPTEEEWDEIEAHWAGLEFGPTILMNNSFGTDFPNHPYWENDPARSFAWNLNFAEHKFKLYRNYVGLTVGLGVNWTQIGLGQYRLQDTQDSIFGVYDSLVTYDKNKLTGIYLTAPLMFEFCTNGDGDDNGFYLAAGIVGGVRVGSNTKFYIEEEKDELQGKSRGEFGLNAFRADATVRLGYRGVGLFANYGLIPMFDTDKTTAVHPLTFGLSLNF